MKRFLLLAPLLWSCASDRVAGGTSSTGNSLTVLAARADGSLAAGDSIYVRPDSLSPDPSQVRVAIADARGGANFSGLPDGVWTVEVRGDSAGAIRHLVLSDGAASGVSLGMAPYTAISGALLMTDSVKTGRAWLRGTGHAVAIDDSGRFRFERASPGEQIVVARQRVDGSLGQALWTLASVPPGSATLAPLHPLLPRSVDWHLDWKDGFDSLRAGTWNLDTGNGCPELCGWGNGSLQSFDAAHVLLRNGALVLRAESTATGWRSGSIQTRARQEFLYGRIEIDARFPAAKGAWSLLSLQGDSTPGPVWPAGGAIDIAGLWGHRPDKLMGIAHRVVDDSIARHPGSDLLTDGSWADRKVVYAIEWSPTEIVWMADDRVFHRVPGGAPFDHPFYLALRLGVGGDGNAVPDSGQAPFEMSIDEVRIYHRIH